MNFINKIYFNLNDKTKKSLKWFNKGFYVNDIHTLGEEYFSIFKSPNVNLMNLNNHLYKNGFKRFTLGKKTYYYHYNFPKCQSIKNEHWKKKIMRRYLNNDYALLECCKYFNVKEASILITKLKNSNKD